MAGYLLQRVLLMLLTLLGVTFMVFSILRLIPGGVENAILGEDATPEQFAALRHQLGLDRPVPVQYAAWFKGVVHGDLGSSLVTHRSISTDIAARFPVTLQLAFGAMLVSLLIAVPVGIISAMRQDTLADYISRSGAIAALAIPGFWVGTLVITFGARIFGYAPPLTYVGIFQDPIENLQIMLPPTIILGAAFSGTIMRLTRTQMLDVLRQDYVRTAKSKGLQEWTIISRHAMKNAAIPVVTIFGFYIPLLFGGTVVLEQIFGVPGMGRYLITAVNQRDFPAIQAIVLVIGSAVVIANLLVDLSYPLLDPRVRLSD
jgi:peptide/nickel transport system permease protein